MDTLLLRSEWGRVLKALGYIEKGPRFSKFLEVYCTVTPLAGFRHFRKYNEISYPGDFAVVEWLLFPECSNRSKCYINSTFICYTNLPFLTFITLLLWGQQFARTAVGLTAFILFSYTRLFVAAFWIFSVHVKQSVPYPHFETQPLLWKSFLFPDAVFDCILYRTCKEIWDLR